MQSSARRYRWTQPCCGECWAQQNPNRYPVRIKPIEAEICCFCGATTYSGIYVRIDPLTVDYPSLRKT